MTNEDVKRLTELERENAELRNLHADALSKYSANAKKLSRCESENELMKLEIKSLKQQLAQGQP